LHTAEALHASNPDMDHLVAAEWTGWYGVLRHAVEEEVGSVVTRDDAVHFYNTPSVEGYYAFPEIVQNQHGYHARPGAMLVKYLKQIQPYDGNVMLFVPGTKTMVYAKSISEVMLSEAHYGTPVHFLYEPDGLELSDVAEYHSMLIEMINNVG